MRVPYSRKLAAGCLVVALLALGVAGTNTALRTVALGVALCALLVGATAASQASAIAASLQGYANRKVNVVAWGTTLPVGSTESLILESAFAISAGLHLQLRAELSGRTYRIKVAQPTHAVIDGLVLSVRDARYVMCERASLIKMSGCAALVVSLNEGGLVLCAA